MTKKSWDQGQRTIDLHLMNEYGYAYMYKIRLLALQYVPVPLPPGTHVQTQLSISCTHFKRILHDCA